MINVKELQKLTKRAKDKEAARQKAEKEAELASRKRMAECRKKDMEMRFKELTVFIPRLCREEASLGRHTCKVYGMENGHEPKVIPDELAKKIFNWCEENGLNPVFKQESRGGHMIGVDEWATDYYANWIEVSW